MKNMLVAFAFVSLLALAQAVTLDEIIASSIGQSAPDAMKSLVGTNVIQAYVTSGASAKYYYAITQDGKVESSGRGRLLLPQPTVLLWADQTTVDRILSSPDAAAETRKAIDKGEIKVEWKNNLFARLSFGLFRLFPINLQGGPAYAPYIPRNPPGLTIPAPNPSFNSQIGPYPGNYACEFYQISSNPPSNKKVVTCAAYKAGDNFCAIAMQSPQAKAVICNDQQVVCTLPCSAVRVKFVCAFDVNRPRGANAPPLDFCPPPPTPPAGPSKKSVGSLCQHGGECTTGNCVGDGMGPPWVYRCSCNPFRMDYGCNK